MSPPRRSPATALAVVDPAAHYALLERLVVGGDLSKLTPKERLTYYRELCASLRLNPLTRPFQYLILDGKLTLYATKDCTEQLRERHQVSITRLEPGGDDTVYRVIASGRNGKGREDVATGVVWIKGLAGPVLANAQMRAETKAKRRLTLSLCGLGVLDESEIADVVIGGEVDVDPETGEIRSAYPPPDALAETEPGPEAGAPDPQIDVLLGRIQAGFDLLRLPPAEQDALWAQFCGALPVMTALAAADDLQRLYEHLAAKYKASVRT